MWLVGVVSVLLTLGFWVCWPRRPRKLAHPAGSAADAAFRRHPAAQDLFPNAGDTAPLPGYEPPGDWAAPRGPDDDAEFLRALDRVIRGEPDRDAEG
jgi:hypothetical protein